MFLDQTQLLILHVGKSLGRHYRGLVKTAFDRAGIALPNPRRLLLVPPRQEALV